MTLIIYLHKEESKYVGTTKKAQLVIRKQSIVKQKSQ